MSSPRKAPSDVCRNQEVFDTVLDRLLEAQYTTPEPEPAPAEEELAEAPVEEEPEETSDVPAVCSESSYGTPGAYGEGCTLPFTEQCVLCVHYSRDLYRLEENREHLWADYELRDFFDSLGASQHEHTPVHVMQNNLANLLPILKKIAIVAIREQKLLEKRGY